MQPFLEKKDESNITSHIYMEIKENTLTVKATDLEIGLSKNIKIQNNIKDGKATINGVNFLNIVRKLNDNDIIIKTEDNNIKIKQNRSNFKLPMYDAEEFPSFIGEELENCLEINPIFMIENLKKITPSIDTNNPKYSLNGALIDIKDSKINFVSTDTRRLSIIKMENISNNQTQLIIPKKAIEQITKLFLDKMSIHYDKSYLIISSNQQIFFTKLINSDFVSYERIIPNSFKWTIKIDKDDFVNSIRLVTILNQDIKIEFNKNEITLNSIDENNKAETKLDIDADIDETFCIASNSKYILDFLSVSSNSSIEMCFNEPNLPFMLKDEKLKTIIMPLIMD